MINPLYKNKCIIATNKEQAIEIATFFCNGTLDVRAEFFSNVIFPIGIIEEEYNTWSYTQTPHTEAACKDRVISYEQSIVRPLKREKK